MRRLNRGLALLACMLGVMLLLAGCGGRGETPLTYFDGVQSTDLSAEQGGGSEVRLGISEQELVKSQGKPLRTLNDGGRSFIFMYEAYQYTSMDDEVQGYSLGPASKTAKGVKLGDAKADVV